MNEGKLTVGPTISARQFHMSAAILIQWATAIATFVLVAAPLGPVLWQSFLDRPLYEGGGTILLRNYTKLFSDPMFHDVLINSFKLALLSTIIACGIGVVFALFLERTRLPGRKFFRSMVLWPMYISQLVMAFAWYLIYGPAGYFTLLGEQIIGVPPWDMYSISGMAIVAGATQAPLVYLFCSSAARMADATLEDAGRSVGASPLRVLWSISLPLMRPSILYSALLVFIGSLEMLAVPLVFGRPAGYEFFTTFLYSRGLGAVTPDYGMIGAAAALLLLIVSLLLVAQGWLLRGAGRFVTVRGKAQRPKLIDLGRTGWTVSIILAVYLILTLFVPLGAIILRSFTTFLTPLLSPLKVLTLDNFILVFSYPVYLRSITNSIIIALLGALLATAFVTLVALVVKRSDFRFARHLEYVALFPRAMPEIVAGIGFFWAMLLLPFVSALQGTIWILMLAFTMRGIPTAFGAIAPALMQVGRELDQSARSAGATWWMSVTRIVLPLIRPALFSAFTLLFLSFLKEYASAVFLFAPGAEILGTTMLSFMANGNSGAVAALSVVQLLITALFISAAHFFTRLIAMSEVIISSLSKRFKDVVALHGIDLHIADGEFLTLLGPSGCGKSTTLFALAGLDKPTSGRICVGENVFYDGATGIDVLPEKRNLGLVFQSYALWPHMTVEQNLAFPLRLRKVESAERASRIAEALDLVDMAPYAKRFPHELSGGQQQRVALARTIVFRPSLLLLDEPLSNLDAKLRTKARGWLKELQRQLGLTTIYVTHDQEEALELSDRIAVMNMGRIEQLDRPESIFRRPANKFVADFIGASNFLPVSLAGQVGANMTRVLLADGTPLRAVPVGDVQSGEGVLTIRPQLLHLSTSPFGGEEMNALAGTIIARSYLGVRHSYRIAIGDHILVAETENIMDPGPVHISFRPEDTLLLMR